MRCATEVLRNNVNKAKFSRSVQELLEKGRGKYRNVMITGAANCGKTFILKPLTLIYDTFSNPTFSSFAWVGAKVEAALTLNIRDRLWVGLSSLPVYQHFPRF